VPPVRSRSGPRHPRRRRAHGRPDLAEARDRPAADGQDAIAHLQVAVGRETRVDPAHQGVSAAGLVLMPPGRRAGFPGRSRPAAGPGATTPPRREPLSDWTPRLTGSRSIAASASGTMALSQLSTCLARDRDQAVACDQAGLRRQAAGRPQFGASSGRPSCRATHSSSTHSTRLAIGPAATTSIFCQTGLRLKADSRSDGATSCSRSSRNCT
jgi:hypothetical protein